MLKMNAPEMLIVVSPTMKQLTVHLKVMKERVNSVTPMMGPWTVHWKMTGFNLSFWEMTP